MFKPVVIVIALMVSLQAWALPESCLQSKSRVNACPHLIYKKAAIDVPALQVKKGQVICLCLSDIKADEKGLTAVEKIDRKVDLDRLAQEYGLLPEDLIKLVKQ